MLRLLGAFFIFIIPFAPIRGVPNCGCHDHRYSILVQGRGTYVNPNPLSDGFNANVTKLNVMARLVEAALREVDKGVIEAAIVMGSTPWQIIAKVLLAESLPSLILAATTTVINLIGYSAMAGAMGGGGLGKIAIQYGYQRFNPTLMMATVVILIILVQLIQWIGQSWAHSLNLARGKGLNR